MSLKSIGISFVLLFCTLLPAQELLLGLRAIASHDSVTTVDLQANLRQVVIPRLATPSFDGSGKGWENAFRDQGFTIMRKIAIPKAKGMQATGDWESFMPAALKPSQDTKLALGFDDQYIYLMVDCLEQAMELLVGHPNAKRDSPIYAGDCIDLTMSKNRNSPNYVQIVIDCNGNRFDTMNIRQSTGDPKEKNRFISDKSWNPDYPVNVTRHDDFWRVCVALPLAASGIEAKAGDFIDLNVCRNEMPSRELSSWGPVENGFHEADKMVRLWLEEQNSSKVFLQQIEYLPARLGKNSYKLQIRNVSATNFEGEIELTATLDKASESSRHEVEIAAGKTLLLPLTWEATSAGNYTVSTILFDGTNPISVGSFTAQIQEPLQVFLGKQSFFSRTKQIPGQIQVSVAEPKEYTLQTKLLENGQELQAFALSKLTALGYQFSVDVTTIKKQAIFQVDLIHQQSGRVFASQSIPLSKHNDAFDDD